MMRWWVAVVFPAVLLGGCAPRNGPTPPPDACTPPAAGSQLVTLRPQETDQWCWAASGKMVMEFLGAPVDQCRQANERFGLTNCCNNPVPWACVRPGWPEFDKYGFTSQKTSSEPLAWNAIRMQIACKKRPFAFSWKWVGNGGHMMVVIGYATVAGSNYVTIYDPLPVNVGDQRIISYDAYSSGSGYTHWDDYYDVVKN